jgi:chromosome segregation and condensation protein ScpB
MELIESPIIYITNGHFLDTYGVVPLSQHPQKEQETRQAHSESSQTT